MPNTPTIVVPGKPFQAQVERLREEMRGIVHSPGASLSVARIFEFIKLAESNAAVQAKLVARGKFDPREDSVYVNSGRPINERVRDIGPNLKGLQLYIGRLIAMRATFTDDDLLLVPIDDSRLLVTFDEAPVPGMPTTFVLRQILGQVSAWRYLFEDEFAPDTKVEIVVDMTLEVEAFAKRRSNMQSFDQPILVLREAESRFLGGVACECLCCQAFKPHPDLGCPPRNVALSFNLHCRIVVANLGQLPAIQAQYQNDVADTQQLFAQLDVTLVDMGAQGIVDPTLLALNPDPCTSIGTSPDIGTLFARHYPQGLGPNDVVAFLVPTLTGAVAGCASHPDGRPGLTQEWNTNAFTLAHELGHVFGLVHMPNSDNLMNPSTPFTNLPPDLSSEQIGDARCSPIMLNLGEPTMVVMRPDPKEQRERTMPMESDEARNPDALRPAFVREFEATEPELARLATFGAEALPHINRYFARENATLAARAVRVAALLEQKLGSDLLERAGNDPRMAVRAALAAALPTAQIDDPERFVARLLEDPEPSIRRLALEAARSLQLTTLVPAMRRMQEAEGIGSLRELIDQFLREQHKAD